MTGNEDAGVIAEQHVRAVSEQLTRPARPECLLCYLNRLVQEFGCDGTLRWSKRWADSQPGGKRFSPKRLERGGGFCDCEVIMNVFRAEIPALIDVSAPCGHVSPP